MIAPKEILKKYWGFSQFRPQQEEIISSVLKQNDVITLLPTGGGKSICFQIPALAKEGICLVISPLIALMKDQIENLERKGIKAISIPSGTKQNDLITLFDNIKFGGYKFLYISPERLQSYFIRQKIKELNINLIAIDEAHCISEWGHDFRPSYRGIKEIRSIKPTVNFIALTATANKKIIEDISKNLDLRVPEIFKQSFLRKNLAYQVFKIEDKLQRVLQIFKKTRKPAIVYVNSRKKTVQIAAFLNANNLKSTFYHGGLSSQEKNNAFENWMKETTPIMVATNAFGMGIDKENVGVVIHLDLPSSIENYVQETGRAGRDDGEGYCLAFYAYKDIEKLEKFMASKPIAEQEIGHALLQEVVGYAETSMSRRKYLLHYFGEEFDEINGAGAAMDDNTKNPKKKHEAKEDVIKLLSVVRDTRDKYKSKDIVNAITGKENALLNSHKTNLKPFFGCGKDKDASYWMALLRQVLVVNFIRKEIEQYGVVKLTKEGEKYLADPSSFMMTEDHKYSQEATADIITNEPSSGVSADEKLVRFLKDLRKKVAVKQGVPPFAVFQDPSLDDMALKYPITLEELSKVHGVGEGKARKFGKEFIDLISKYVEDNDVVRPDDLIVKSTGVNSGLKLYIIQNTDRKLPLIDIAKSKGLDMEKLIKEMEVIIFSGTKLNIDYSLDDLLDEDQQEEIYEYFMEAESDKIQDALDEFDGEYDEEELRLMRIKFINEVAN